MPRVWTIVLAAGHGRRLAEVTGGLPKQFWCARGQTTLLENTLERLAPLTAPERTVVVVDKSHEPYVRPLGLGAEHVLFQPRDRGTAAGVLLSILPILDADPDAVIVMSPADHGVGQVGLFRSGIAKAVSRVARRGSGIVLAAAEPSAVDGSFGWIQPGRPSRNPAFRAVAAFVEKPGPARARALLQRGAVWNTMVLVAPVQSLCQLIANRQPELYAALSEAWRHTEWPRAESLARAYARLPAIDFSQDVVTGTEGLEVFTWPVSMGWSDLGTPKRLFAWLEAPDQARRTSISAA
ncbi:MAG TPA: sugar phosphate nucleotidyltransferase [Vicinamibacterales bacterium]|nr:sugar phosphate nucleotidyltransferase [Vicinamibacterales bacterium]